MVIICQALLADKADLSERWKLSLECHQSVPQQTCHMSLGRHQSVLSRHAECQQIPVCLQVELMVVKNQALLTEKAELRRQGQLAEQTEQELAKKSQVFQRTIKSLVRQPVASIDDSLIVQAHVVGGACLAKKSQVFQESIKNLVKQHSVLSALM